MKNRKFMLASAVACLGVAVAVTASLATAKPGKQTKVFKVAWIYPGPYNDGGWSTAHDDGRKYAEKVLGAKIQTTYKDKAFSNAQVPQMVAGLVRDGYQMIFGTSFGEFELGVNGQLHQKYPNVLFEQATGTLIAKNQSEYFGRAEDTIYLSGMAAGAASKKGVIGYIVPFGIPEVVRHLNAFTLGAQATHPGAKVKIIWTNSWLAPDKEKKAAQNLKAAGADVIGQNVDDPAIGQYDESVGIPWVGYDSDAKKFAPKQWLTGAVYNWGPYYLAEVKAAMGGTWKSQFWYGSMKSGFTKLASFGPRVSAKTKALIAARQKAIENGSWYEFQGPLYDQAGKLRVKKGQRLTVKDLYAMNWLVKGVIGSPKG